MKLIRLLALILLCCIQTSSFAMNKSNKIEEEIGITVGDNQKYIRFEFGGGNTYITYIIEGDSCCEVYMTKEKEGPITHTACDKTPILKWAFDGLKEELKSAEYMSDNAHKSFYYILSLFENNEEIIADSSKKHVTGNKGLEKKIKELRSFIIDELLIKNYDGLK